MKSKIEDGFRFANSLSHHDFCFIYFTFEVTLAGNKAFRKSLDNAALSSKDSNLFESSFLYAIISIPNTCQSNVYFSSTLNV